MDSGELNSEYKRRQGAKILNCYGGSIEKSGEGSRGGKIIGHTTTGKPIYESHSHEAHREFSFKEHNEAADLHKKEKENLDSRMKKEYHDKISDLDDDEIFGDKHKEIQKVGDEIRGKRKFHEEQHYGHVDEANKKFKNM